MVEGDIGDGPAPRANMEAKIKKPVLFYLCDWSSSSRYNFVVVRWSVLCVMCWGLGELLVVTSLFEMMRDIMRPVLCFGVESQSYVVFGCLSGDEGRPRMVYRRRLTWFVNASEIVGVNAWRTALFRESYSSSSSHPENAPCSLSGFFPSQITHAHRT